MTYKEVQDLCQKHGKSIKDFDDFIYGQTVGVINGEIDYYECDVENFIGKRHIITTTQLKSPLN